jgi:hypothetical protein
MTALIADGFDDGLIVGATGGIAPTVSTTIARTGARSARIFQSAGAGNVSYLQYTVNNKVSGVIHFSWYTPTLWSGLPIIQLLDNGTLHGEVRMRADGRFDLYTVGTLRATGTFVYAINTHVHLQIKFTIADAGGLIELRVNGATSADATYTGDTRNGANAFITETRIGHCSGAINTTGVASYVDDVFIVDTAGSVNNDYCGDVECRYLRPTGAGSQQDWTIAGSAPAATAHQSVNETPVDDGVTLLQTANPNDRFLLALADLSNTTPTVFAVATNLRAQKASAATREIKSTMKLGGSTTLGGLHTLSTSWLTHQDIRETDPAGNPWTGANVNASELGADLVT